MPEYYYEEEKLGKTYDSKLMKRLFLYIKPYRRLIILSVALLIVITVFDLSLPYLTKIAIDRYIIVGVRELVLDESEFAKSIKDKYASRIISVDGRTFVKKLERGDLGRLQREGFLKESFYIKDGRIIRWDDMKKLDKSQLLSLREEDIKGVAIIALVFLVVLLVSFVFNFVQIYVMEYMAQRVMYDLRMSVFTHLQKLSLSFFDKNPVGRLVTRVTNDIEAIYEMFTEVLVYFFKDIFLIVGIVVVLLKMNWRLALVSFAIVPGIIWITLIFSRKIRLAFREVRLKIAKINASLQENISGMRAVQIFRRERENYRRFKEINYENFLANMRQIKIFAVFSPLISVASSACVALIIWYGGGEVISQTLSLGALVAFISYIEMFFRPIRDISEKYNIMQSAMASSERVFLLMDNQSMIKNPETPKRIKDLKGKIEFKNVWFAYDKDEWVLEDVSFTVNEGESIAIVGATGAGKTSLMNLLERFYDVNRGEILVDGVNIKAMDKEWLRANIGLVMQDVFLFAEDIKGNVRLGNEKISEEEIRRVANYVNADRFIEKLPKQYDEEVKERGVTLSTGERQLLSFARALAFNPKILVLDEATANIDTETEKLIQDALVKLLRGRTSIVVAHRLSTIQNVDRIIVMHKGRIKERGTHQQLLAKKGYYYRLYQLQYKK